VSCLETYIKKLLGGADIEDALKRLDNLIREEHQAATAQVLLGTSELRDGACPFLHDS
jgi:predicted ArsR family transcriptional regulator